MLSRSLPLNATGVYGNVDQRTGLGGAVLSGVGSFLASLNPEYVPAPPVLVLAVGGLCICHKYLRPAQENTEGPEVA